MRAIRLTDGRLIAGEIERPRPEAGEALVRVIAAGVTPTELEWYPTTHTKSGDPRAGAVPAHEFSGELEGSGEAVFGLNDWFADGALAEFCVTRPEWIAPKPKSLSHAEAATVPISALTAWQGLHDRVKLRSGERVLVNGGAGAVGAYVVQLARRAGARVTATVSAKNVEFVKSLGAERAIDYRNETVTGEFDVVFDTVGNAPEGSGRLVTIVGEGQNKPEFFIVEPNRAQLIEIAGLIDAGELTPFLDSVVPFDQAAGAYRRKAGRGKMAVAVAPETTRSN